MGATFNIEIKVSASSAHSSIRGLESGLSNIQNQVLQLNRMLRQLFGVFAIKEIVTGLYSMVNGYQEIQNKLRVVAKDQENLNGLQDTAFEIAQRTRTSYAASGTLLARVVTNSKTLGISQKQAAEFTEQWMKAMIIGGATTQEAHSATIQMTQGLASGALKGDELRAVMESSSYATQTLAKGLGITVGQLREAGKNGKITGVALVKAFHDAKKAIDEDFAKTIPTLSQSFVVLHNAAQRFFGQMGEGSGVLDVLRDTIAFIANNFETFGKILLIVGQLIGVYVAQWAIGKLIEALRLLATVANNHPLRALIYVIGIGILILRQFGDKISVGTNLFTKFGVVTVTVRDYLVALWTEIKALGSEIWDLLSGAWNALIGAFSSGLDTEGIELSFRNVLLIVASVIGSIKGLFMVLKKDGTEIFGGLAVIMVKKLIDALNAIMNAMVSTLNSMRTAMFNFISDVSGRKETADAKAMNDLNARLNKGSEKGSGESNSAIMRGTIAREQAESMERAGIKPRDLADQPGIVGIYDPKTKKLYNVFVASVDAEYNRRKASTYEAFRTAAREDEGLDPKTGRAIGSGSFGGVQVPYPKWVEVGAAFAEEMIDGAKKVMTDEATKAMENVTKNAALNAIERKKKSLQAGYLSDDKGKPDPNNEKAKHDPWPAKFESLMRRSNDILEAELKMRQANEILDEANRRDKLTPKHEVLGSEFMQGGIAGMMDKLTGKTTGGGVGRASSQFDKYTSLGGTVLKDLEQELRHVLRPYDDWTGKILESTAAMKGSEEEVQKQVEFTKLMEDLANKGFTINDAQVEQVKRLIALNHERRNQHEQEKAVLQDIQQPLKTYVLQLKAIHDLEKSKDITGADSVLARKKASDAYIESLKNRYEAERAIKYQASEFGPILKGWDDGVKRIAEDILDVSGTLANLMKGTFDNLNNFIVETANTGKFAWGTLTKDIEKMITQLALKILEMKLLLTIMPNNPLFASMKGAAGLSPGSLPAVNAAASAAAASATSAAASAAAASASAATAMAAIAQLGAMQITSGASGIGGGFFNSVAGHAAGASAANAAASSAADSAAAEELVSGAIWRTRGRVTPGERVDTYHPGQTSQRESTSDRGKIGVHIHNHVDKHALMSTMDSPDGKRRIMNTVIQTRQALKKL